MYYFFYLHILTTHSHRDTMSLPVVTIVQEQASSIQSPGIFNLDSMNTENQSADIATTTTINTNYGGEATAQTTTQDDSSLFPSGLLMTTPDRRTVPRRPYTEPLHSSTPQQQPTVVHSFVPETPTATTVMGIDQLSSLVSSVPSPPRVGVIKLSISKESGGGGDFFDEWGEEDVVVDDDEVDDDVDTGGGANTNAAGENGEAVNAMNESPASVEYNKQQQQQPPASAKVMDESDEAAEQMRRESQKLAAQIMLQDQLEKESHVSVVKEEEEEAIVDKARGVEEKSAQEEQLPLEGPVQAVSNVIQERDVVSEQEQPSYEVMEVADAVDSWGDDDIDSPSDDEEGEEEVSQPEVVLMKKVSSNEVNGQHRELVVDVPADSVGEESVDAAVTTLVEVEGDQQQQCTPPQESALELQVAGADQEPSSLGNDTGDDPWGDDDIDLADSSSNVDDLNNTSEEITTGTPTDNDDAAENAIDPLDAQTPLVLADESELPPEESEEQDRVLDSQGATSAEDAELDADDPWGEDTLDIADSVEEADSNEQPTEDVVSHELPQPTPQNEMGNDPLWEEEQNQHHLTIQQTELDVNSGEDGVEDATLPDGDGPLEQPLPLDVASGEGETVAEQPVTKVNVPEPKVEEVDAISEKEPPALPIENKVSVQQSIDSQRNSAPLNNETISIAANETANGVNSAMSSFFEGAAAITSASPSLQAVFESRATNLFDTSKASFGWGFNDNNSAESSESSESGGAESAAQNEVRGKSTSEVENKLTQDQSGGNGDAFDSDNMDDLYNDDELDDMYDDDDDDDEKEEEKFSEKPTEDLPRVSCDGNVVENDATVDIPDTSISEEGDTTVRNGQSGNVPVEQFIQQFERMTQSHQLEMDELQRSHKMDVDRLENELRLEREKNKRANREEVASQDKYLAQMRDLEKTYNKTLKEKEDKLEEVMKRNEGMGLKMDSMKREVDGLLKIVDER